MKLPARVSERRSGPLATLTAIVLAVPLGPLGSSSPSQAWRAAAGAVTELWAIREERAEG